MISIGHTLLRYGDLMVFQMPSVHHLAFVKFPNFSFWYHSEGSVRDHTKYCQDM